MYMHMQDPICVIQLSACDVTLAKSLGLRFCASKKDRTGGGGRISTQGPDSMAASGLSCRKPFVGTGWDISFLLYTNGLRKHDEVGTR